MPNVRGKIGNVVYTTYKQGVVARAYQPSVTNPRSMLQVAQRTRFTYVNRALKEFTEGMQKMYGTSKLTYQRSALMKTLLSSAQIKLVGNAKSSEFPDIAHVNQAQILNSKTTIGMGYTEEGLNVFEEGVTCKALDFHQTGIEKDWTAESHNKLAITHAQILINGNFRTPSNSDFAEEAQNKFYYFGCDYHLPKQLVLSYFGSSWAHQFPTSLLQQQLEIISTEYNQDGTMMLPGKNRGFYTNLAACGDDWAFYYAISPDTMQTYSIVLGTSMYYPILSKNYLNRRGFFLMFTRTYVLGAAMAGQNGGATIQVLKSSSLNIVSDISPTMRKPGA